MLTVDFSLCLIQCAISRCIIYFCVKSLTAVICHDDDDVMMTTIILMMVHRFPDTRMLHSMFPPPYKSVREITSDLLGSRFFFNQVTCPVDDVILLCVTASNE